MMMDGTFIDVAFKKLQWLLDHPEVTWSGSGIYALSLTGSAAFAVASWCFWRKKKSPPSSEEHLRQPLSVQKTDNQFNSGGGEQNSAQGENATGKLVNNHNVSPEYLTQYAEEFGVTKAALSNFFRILEQAKVPSWELDSKLREIAFRHKELLGFKSVQSDVPQVQDLKEQAKQAIECGNYDLAEELLNQAKEKDHLAAEKIKRSEVVLYGGMLQDYDVSKATESKLSDAESSYVSIVSIELSEIASCVEQAMLQRLQYRYEKSAKYWLDAAVLAEGYYEWERVKYLSAAGYDLHRVARYADALELYEQSLFINRKIDYRKGKGKLLNNIAAIYDAQGEYEKALDYLEQSLSIRQEVGDKKGEGMTLNNIAAIYQSTGDYPKALSYLKQSLVLWQEIDDKGSEGNILYNIGAIHYAQDDYAAAMQYFDQALVISREIKDKTTESKVLNNVSQVYKTQGKIDLSLKHLEQSLIIVQQIGDRRGEGLILNNIAKIYDVKGSCPSALKHYEKALDIAKELGAKTEEASSNWNIGLLYATQDKPIKAEAYLSRTVELMAQLEHPMLQECRQLLEDVRAKLRRNGNTGHNT